MNWREESWGLRILERTAQRRHWSCTHFITLRYGAAMLTRTISALTVDWIKCQSNSWCGFLSVDLNHEHFDSMEGVYIIWHGGQYPATVYVGQGIIRDRLRQHREEREILACQSYGLYATWAAVSLVRRDGVERYLADTLRPKVGHRYPDAEPIAVKLPWK